MGTINRKKKIDGSVLTATRPKYNNIKVTSRPTVRRTRLCKSTMQALFGRERTAPDGC